MLLRPMPGKGTDLTMRMDLMLRAMQQKREEMKAGQEVWCFDINSYCDQLY